MSVRLRIERLEDRLAPANLTMSSVNNMDAYNNALANPVYGQNIYLRAAWNANGMAGGESCTVRFTVNGVSVDSASIVHIAGTASYSRYQNGWYIGNTPWTVTATIDPDNLIAETNENDNTVSIVVTPVAPIGLPATKFLTPIGRTANLDWAINNYADVLPNASQADYRGGPFTYNGHDAVDAGPFGFYRMDAGFPIVAADGGTVTQVADGNFDREPSGSSNPANFVLINHGNNWETLYYHLAKNTITVKAGDTVKAGQVIGMMGSSGNSSGPHLHFNPRYRGAQIETGLAPALYSANPLPYGGDVPAFGLDAFYTNYSPASDQNERPSPTSSFGTSEPGTTLLYFALESYNLKLTDFADWKWYQPDGTLAFSNHYVPSFDTRFALKGFAQPLSAFQSIPGTWQVAWEINGVEYKRLPLTINATGEASARVTESGKIVIDERTTPLDFGNIASGGAGPTKVFTINNHGGATLNLSNLQLPPGFSLSGVFPATIAPGANATFTVKLETAVVGSKFGRASFQTNDPDTPLYNYNLTGIVTGSIPVGTPAISLPDAALGYNFRSLPRPFAPSAVVTDSDSANFNGGILTAELASGGNAFDVLGIQNQGSAPNQIGVNGSVVSLGGVSIGTFAGGSSLQPLVVSLYASATPGAVQALLRNLTYSNTHSVPNYARRYLRLTLTDDTARVSNLAIAFVSPSGVERAPTIPALAPAMTAIGTPFSRNGNFSDSYGNTWSATVDYGDGSGAQALVLNADQTFALAHTYMTPSDYSVTVTIFSDTGGIRTGAMTVSVVQPPTVTGILVNANATQHSRLTSITVSFFNPVDVATLAFPGAITLTRTLGGPATVVQTGATGANGRIILTPANGSVNSITLTFDNANGAAISAGVESGSLTDGRWRLTIPGLGYQSPLNDVILRRLFGDLDANGTVNAEDFAQFGNVFGKTVSNSPFDFNNDGIILADDFAEFGNRFGVTL